MMEGYPANLKIRLGKAALVVLVLLALYLSYYLVLPAVLATIHFVVPLFLPVILALILAGLLDPVVEYGQRLGLKRVLSTSLVLMISLVMAVLLITMVITQLVTELTRLSMAIPQWSPWIVQTFNLWVRKAEEFYLQLPDQALNTVQGGVVRLVNGLNSLLETVITSLLTLLSSLPSIFLILVVGLVATYFLMRDKKMILKGFYQELPPAWADRVVQVVGDVASGFMGYLRAQVLLMSISAMQAIGGFFLLGVEYAFTLGLLIAIADLLPVLGPGTVLLPWALLELLMGNSFRAIMLAILYGLITVVRQILEPKLVGARIGIHPLAILVSIYVGLKAMGFLGVVIGPLTLVLWQSLKRAGILPRWRQG